MQSMNIFYAASFQIKNNDCDVGGGTGCGFVVVALVSILYSPNANAQGYLISIYDGQQSSSWEIICKAALVFVV